MKRQSTSLIAGAVLALALFVPGARAGSYVVAQCSPRLYPGRAGCGFAATTSHYIPTPIASGSTGLTDHAQPDDG